MFASNALFLRLRAASPALRNVRFASSGQEITIPLKEAFKGHLLTPPEDHITVSSDTMVDLYKKMVLIRRLETASDQLYKAKLVHGFLHLYNGQEAVATGMESVATLDDAIITAYRDHAFALLRGCTPESIIAELLGKASGCSGGRGGSMHMYNSKTNFYGGNGIVGAHIPVGVGIALAQKYKGTKNMTWVYYGDGAANQGQLFEAHNMAALWKLPVALVCENNHYGMGTSTSRAHAAPGFYQQANYIPGLWVDGMDVLAVRRAAQFTSDWVRGGNGPICLEMETYRYVGHSMSDPGTSYRSREEVQGVREKRDPIARLKNQLLNFEIATEEEMKGWEASIKKSIDEAVKAAKAAPFPDESTLGAHILEEHLPVRGVDLKHTYVS